jgi:uncharacterized protein (DUF4415 family)
MLEEAEKIPQVFDEDCPKLTAAQLEQFRPVYTTHAAVTTITLHINTDVLQWYRDQGGDYEERINAALRREMALA